MLVTEPTYIDASGIILMLVNMKSMLVVINASIKIHFDATLNYVDANINLKLMLV